MTTKPFQLVPQQAALPVEFDDPVKNLFEFWKALMGHERAQLGPKRRQAVERAMEWGYSLDDLRLAVLGCRCSPRHQGQNEERAVYDDLELCVRDEAHIDKFIRLGEQEVKKMLAKDAERAAQAAEQSAPRGMSEATRAKLDSVYAKIVGSKR